MPKILIVDDEPSILALLRIVFTHEGYEVLTAAGPKAAMDLCESQTFDIVLSDVRMPGMDGHALARWIATKQPSVRTVLMSGYDLECQQCPLAPRCALVRKPFDTRSVVQAVEKERQKSAAA